MREAFLFMRKHVAPTHHSGAVERDELRYSARDGRADEFANGIGSGSVGEREVTPFPRDGIEAIPKAGNEFLGHRHDANVLWRFVDQPVSEVTVSRVRRAAAISYAQRAIHAALSVAGPVCDQRDPRASNQARRISFEAPRNLTRLNSIGTSAWSEVPPRYLNTPGAPDNTGAPRR